MTEIYLDIETERWSGEVPGGWGNIPGFGMALAVTWEESQGYTVWMQGEAGDLIKSLVQHDHIITFNGERFDFKVLSAYGDVGGLYDRSFDLLAILEKELGHRVSLDSLARATLGRGKVGDGKEAVAWFRSGNKVMLERVIGYCKNDVDLLRDLVAYGRRHGHLNFLDRDGRGHRVVPYREIEVGVVSREPKPEKHLILTVGLPRSGKTTWAMRQRAPVVSRDAIRLALSGQAYIQANEDEVTAIEDCMVKALFLAGHDTVIVDACHITPERRERWRGMRGDWRIDEKIFPVGEKVCTRRAISDGRYDLLAEIERMANETDIKEIVEADNDGYYPVVNEHFEES